MAFPQYKLMKFDVFLSHNSKDKPVVRKLKHLLSARGVVVWLDEDELQPGIPWQQLLEAGIETSRSVAVLVGKDGLGPWEDEEMRAALELAVRKRRPAIPVLLPGASAQPDLPMFLVNRTWVDLRAGFAHEGIAKLVWGITGRKPAPTPGGDPPDETRVIPPQPPGSSRDYTDKTVKRVAVALEEATPTTDARSGSQPGRTFQPGYVSVRAVAGMRNAGMGTQTSPCHGNA